MKQKNLILMVVAVGCGLVAAFLTSQMSAKPAQVDKIEVIVAARDLTVGSQLTQDELKTAVKRKLISKDAVPPTVIETEEELLEKRFTRTIRAEEMINKADVSKGSVVSIPPGMNMVSLPIDLSRAVAGFVGPGSRVDILGSVRGDTKIIALPVLVNMLVLAVDANTAYPDKSAAYQNLSTVSFAVDRKQALLIKLAQARGCELSLLLRNPEDKVNENDKNYDIDKVIKLLADNHLKTGIEDESGPPQKNDAKPAPETSPAPKPAETVKVPYALADIPAGTEITADLIADAAKFGTRELPKDVAEDAATDLTPFVGQVLKNGLGKGQWVTRGLVGKAELKPAPRTEFNPWKDGTPDAGPKPVPVVRKTHDVAVHTAAGTKYFRYEEVAPGEWRMRGEVRPGAESAKPAETQVD